MLHDVDAEIEELLERLQVLIRLLTPLSKTDQHEVLLQVTLLFGERMEPCVLDRNRRPEREALNAFHLFGRESAQMVSLAEHCGADRLAVGDQRKGEQRAHPEPLHVRRADEAVVAGGVLHDQRLPAVENVE